MPDPVTVVARAVTAGREDGETAAGDGGDPAGFIVTVVALMTWLVMPRLSRWLGQWLYRSRGDAPELTLMSNGDNA
jgi:hypothetical protein